MTVADLRTRPRRGAAAVVAPDIACVRIAFVNVYLIGRPGAGDREWVLVDAGLPGSAGRIARAAAEWLGAGRRRA
ncbi:MAG TPA: hypothetical protein VNK43_10405, partial [Gemmatimonadales bacterium]|nr:hypothetical protein [Gemmatimonadales bacterium]